MRTQSEIWFEEYCANRGVPCSRIEESNGRTPDYELDLDGQKIIVEVKEILPNAEEKASIEKLKRESVGLATGGTPGERVRGKIADASGQIKAKTDGRLASLLLLCDIKYGCGQITGHVNPYNIRVAMEGLDQLILALPQDRHKPPYTTGMKSGPKKKMTDMHNTSISGIGVLSTPPGAPISLVVYHNRYAAIPIPADKLQKHNIPQYCLSGNPGGPSNWVEI
jgi:hypothetical protein